MTRSEPPLDPSELSRDLDGRDWDEEPPDEDDEYWYPDEEE